MEGFIEYFKTLNNPISWIVGLFLTSFLFAVRDQIRTMYLKIFNTIGSAIKTKFRAHIFTRRDLFRESKIQELLVELRVINDSDRANVYLFHNGGVFTTNLPQFKISKTHESLSPGISSTFDRDKDTRCSAILNFIRPLFEKTFAINGIDFIDGSQCACERLKNDGCSKVAYLINVENLDVGYTKSSLKEKGVAWAVVTPILNIKQDVVGFVSVEYCSSALCQENVLTKCKNICQYSSDISFYLNQIH